MPTEYRRPLVYIEELKTILQKLREAAARGNWFYDHCINTTSSFFVYQKQAVEDACMPFEVLPSKQGMMTFRFRWGD